MAYSLEQNILGWQTVCTMLIFGMQIVGILRFFIH